MWAAESLKNFRANKSYDNYRFVGGQGVLPSDYQKLPMMVLDPILQ